MEPSLSIKLLILSCPGFGHEAGTSLAVLILLLPKSRRHVFTGKVNPYSQARIPVFGANTFSTSDGSSYMGFHRPTRVVPPSSYGSSTPSSTPSSSLSYHQRYQANRPFGYHRFENTGEITSRDISTCFHFPILGPVYFLPPHTPYRAGHLDSHSSHQNYWSFYDKYNLLRY